MFTRTECLKCVCDGLGGLCCSGACPHLVWALIVLGAVMVTFFFLLKLSRMLLKGNKIGCLTTYLQQNHQRLRFAVQHSESFSTLHCQHSPNLIQLDNVKKQM